MRMALARTLAMLLILATLCLSCAALAEDLKPQYTATKDFVAVPSSSARAAMRCISVAGI